MVEGANRSGPTESLSLSLVWLAFAPFFSSLRIGLAIQYEGVRQLPRREGKRALFPMSYLTGGYKISLRQAPNSRDSKYDRISFSFSRLGGENEKKEKRSETVSGRADKCLTPPRTFLSKSFTRSEQTFIY